MCSKDQARITDHGDRIIKRGRQQQQQWESLSSEWCCVQPVVVVVLASSSSDGVAVWDLRGSSSITLSAWQHKQTRLLGYTYNSHAKGGVRAVILTSSGGRHLTCLYLSIYLYTPRGDKYLVVVVIIPHIQQQTCRQNLGVFWKWGRPDRGAGDTLWPMSGE